jgi:hypothetical protein
MGQTTRSQGISFTHEMWARIEARYRALKFGRSQYFQALVDRDLHELPEIYAHKSDGKWHLYPESETAANREALRAAEEAAAARDLPEGPRLRRKRRSP